MKKYFLVAMLLVLPMISSAQVTPPIGSIIVPAAEALWTSSSSQSVIFQDNVSSRVTYDLLLVDAWTYTQTPLLTSVYASTTSAFPNANRLINIIVPGNIASGLYRIKICPVRGIPCSQSAAFNIRYVLPPSDIGTVTAPTTYDVWSPGSTYLLQFQDGNANRLHYALWLIDARTNFQSPLANDAIAVSGPFPNGANRQVTITVPTTVGAGPYRLKICPVGSLPCSQSVQFSIVPIGIGNITQPAAGANWTIGSSYSVEFLDQSPRFSYTLWLINAQTYAQTPLVDTEVIAPPGGVFPNGANRHTVPLRVPTVNSGSYRLKVCPAGSVPCSQSNRFKIGTTTASSVKPTAHAQSSSLLANIRKILNNLFSR